MHLKRHLKYNLISPLSYKYLEGPFYSILQPSVAIEIQRHLRLPYNFIANIGENNISLPKYSLISTRFT